MLFQTGFVIMMVPWREGMDPDKEFRALLLEATREVGSTLHPGMTYLSLQEKDQYLGAFRAAKSLCETKGQSLELVDDERWVAVIGHPRTGTFAEVLLRLVPVTGPPPSGLDWIRMP